MLLSISAASGALAQPLICVNSFPAVQEENIKGVKRTWFKRDESLIWLYFACYVHFLPSSFFNTHPALFFCFFCLNLPC